MIDSLKTVLNLQILTIEKTLLSLNKLLETTFTNEITATATTFSKMVNDLVSKMIQQKLEMQNKHDRYLKTANTKRWNSSTSTAPPKAKVIRKRIVGDQLSVDPILAVQLKHQSIRPKLMNLIHLYFDNMLRWKRFAFDRFKGDYTSSIGTIAALDKSQNYQHIAGTSNNRTFELDKSRNTESLMNRIGSEEDHEKCDFNLLQATYDQESHDEDQYCSSSESSTGDGEQRRSPELFNAVDGEPLDMTEVSNFYRPIVMDEFHWGGCHDDVLKSRKRADVTSQEKWNKVAKVSSSPAVARIQKRVTFDQIPEDIQGDAFLNKLEAEMIPFFEKSQESRSSDRKWKLQHISEQPRTNGPTISSTFGPHIIQPKQFLTQNPPYWLGLDCNVSSTHLNQAFNTNHLSYNDSLSEPFELSP